MFGVADYGAFVAAIVLFLAIPGPGHLALILPLFARPPVRRWTIGLYEYLGEHRWRAHGGCRASRVLNIEATTGQVPHG